MTLSDLKWPFNGMPVRPFDRGVLMSSSSRELSMGWVNRLNARVGLSPAGSKFSLWYGLDLVEEIGPTDNSGLVLTPYEQEAKL